MSAVAFAIGLAALLWWFAGQPGGVLQRADSLSSVASLVVGVASLALSAAGLVLSGRQPTMADGDGSASAGAAAWLAGAVRRQWSEEVGVRRLRHPRPLRLRWSRTQRPVAVGGDRESECARTAGSAPLSGALVPGAGGRPAADALVEAFRRLPVRQLVVLGRPGAGKSVLAMFFTLAAIDLARPGEPVPVLLPAAGWDPREPLRAWVARRIREDYPELGNAAAFGVDAPDRLVAGNLVLPVLDGLDEMPGPLLAEALARIDELPDDGSALVVTCRGEEYERAVRAAGALSTAAVVEIAPIEPDDAIGFLTEAEIAGSTRWRAVTDRMRADPEGALATALSTPLMIALARTVYRAPASTPAELDRFPDAAAVDGHLLEGFLSTVYRRTAAERAAAEVRSYPPDRARRWLALLARHLRYPADPASLIGDRAGPGLYDDSRHAGTDLAWWRLARTVPRIAVIFVVAAAVTAVGGVAGLIGAAALAPDELGGNAVKGAALGLPVGLIAGLNAGRAGRRTQSPRVLAVLATALRDGLVTAATLVLTITPVAPDLQFGLDWTYAQDATVLLLGGMVGGTALSMITNGISAGRSPVPNRPSLGLSTLWLRLLAGLGTGFLFSLPLGLVVGFLVGIEEWKLRAGVVGGLLTTIGVAVAVGIPVGIGRWLGVPVTEQEALSPRSTLRGDRSTLLAITAAASVPISLAAIAFALLAEDNTEWNDALQGGLWLGLTVAVLVVFGSGSPWLSYSAARLWLALWGRLPWRLMRFLEDAHRRGVLRRAGAVYQFRHLRLQHHLARTPEPDRTRGLVRRTVDATAGGPPAPARRPGRWARWRAATGTVGAAAVLLAATAVVTIPDLRSTINEHIRQEATAALLAAAERAEPDDPDAALRLRIAAYQLDDSVLLLPFAHMRATGAARAYAVAPTRPWSWSTNGHMVYAIDGDAGNAVILGGEPLLRRVDVGSNVAALRTSLDGRRAVATLHNNRIVLWDLTTTPPRHTELSPRSVQSHIDPDGRRAIVVGGDGSIAVWDLTATPPRRTVLEEGAAPVAGDTVVLPFVTVAADGRRAVVFRRDRGTALWDLATTPPRRIDLGRAAPYNGVRVGPDGRRAVVIDAAARAALWDLTTTPPRRTALSPGAEYARFHRDGHRVVVVGRDGSATLWELGTTPPGRTDLGRAAHRAAVQVSADGRRAIVIGPDARAALWDLTTTPARRAELSRGAAYARLSPESRRAVVVGTDGSAALWDLTTSPPRSSALAMGDLSSPVPGTGATVDFSPGDNWMIMRDPRRLREPDQFALWRAEPTAVARIASMSAESAVFTADGRSLVTIDKSIAIAWDLAELARRPLLDERVGDPYAYACRVAGRGLTRAEWDRHVPGVSFHRTC